ncbi:response regulator transcription factor [Amycolatopsis sp. NPDC021455]|uniref:response regulator transcription factor n=1 Tax=Amycolatopsis sp. NPDC021455 TaxID=3154901 RepID=UPI0033F2B719
MDSDRNPQVTLEVLVIAGIRFYRDGLAATLAGLPEVGEVRTAAGGGDGLAAVRWSAPDIVLLDMGLPDAVSVARALSRVAPRASIVALGLQETEDRVLACVEAGITGYVGRESSLGDLVRAVRAAARGEAVCSARITGSLMRRVAAVAGAVPAARPTRRLTAREREIVELIANGLVNREIADRLGIELCTVKNHVHNILDKLGVTNRAAVAAFARAAI